MDPFTYLRAFKYIKSDKKYLSDRSTLHHNYELLEGFWRHRFPDMVDPFDQFIKQFGEELWNVNKIRAAATQFASIECVGSSNVGGFLQTEEIAKATMYLRFHSSLFKKNIPTCNVINCRLYKKDKNLCSKYKGRLWTKKNHPYSSFKALMFIIRQVRNNLFHGSKFNLEPDQYKRDKKLIGLSAKVTELLIENISQIINKSYT